MDLRHLTSFVVVAEELHFHRAAERLHITQPSLSQQLRQLEKDLGTTLLVRTTRRVELTTAGRELLSRARLILTAVDDAVHATGQAAQGKVGRLTVGFTGTSTYELLPTMARMFRRDSPQVELVLRGEMVTPLQSMRFSLERWTSDFSVRRSTRQSCIWTSSGLSHWVSSCRRGTR